MSGIIGFFSTDCNMDACKKVLTYWNQNYGTKQKEQQISEKIWMAVNLNHLSESVPELNTFLRRDSYSAVIDSLIYNRAEIIKKYSLSSTSSDEELIFSLILNHGPEALKDVNGDFSGVLYDSERQFFTVFRDHMGIRPLYYYIDEHTFVFSTDMRGILGVPGLNIKINENHLFRQLSGLHGCNRIATDYEQIQYVQKSCWFTIKINGTHPEKSNLHEYWKLGAKKIRMKSDQEYTNKLRELIEDSVKIRVNAIDAPVGTEFSGGLDSSVLAVLLARMRKDSKYYSWSSDPEEWPIRSGKDERKIILDICKRENISCQFKTIESSLLKDTASNIIQRLYPPYANTLQISMGCTWFQSQGVKAVLTGHGGDQGVSHRCHQYELWYNREYFSFIRASYNAMQGRKHRLYGTFKDVIRRLTVDHPLKTVKNTELWGATNIHHLMNPEFLSKMISCYKPESSAFGFDIIEYFKRGATRERMDNTAFQGANFGIQYLFPYLDYRVIDYAVSIPRYLFNNGKRNRLIYLKAFADLIPDSLDKMHDKENTSNTDRYEFSKDEILSENSLTKELLDEMDVSFWKDYLDLDHIDRFYLPDDATEKECFLHSIHRASLLYCNILRYDMIHAGDAALAKENHV